MRGELHCSNVASARAFCALFFSVSAWFFMAHEPFRRKRGSNSRRFAEKQENLSWRRIEWWASEDSNFQPNDYQLLASRVPEVLRFATSALSPQIGTGSSGLVSADKNSVS